MNIANQLSILRLILAPIFVGCLFYYSEETKYFYSISIALFVVACISDGLDGFLAKKLNQRTTLGSYIDPIADKLLLISGFLSLTLMSNLPPPMRIPAWVAIPVIARDLIILIGAVIIFLVTGNLKAKPFFIGKLTTAFQMCTLFVALIQIPFPVRMIFFIVTVLLTLVSGASYLKEGGRLLK